MRFAVVDLGSSAVRFEVFDTTILPPQILYKDRQVIRLGSGVKRTGFLNPEAKPLARNFIDRCLAKMSEIEISKIRFVATSAFREAVDGLSFAEELSNHYNIQIEILSGEEEANLIAKGILTFENSLSDSCLLIDIGGGSVELSFCTKHETASSLAATYSTSLPLGAVYCHQEFLKVSPPIILDGLGITGLINHTKNLLNALPPELKDLNPSWAIGSSGTARSLAELAENNSEIALSSLESTFNYFKTLSLEELYAIPKMEKSRADVILAGLVVLIEILKFYSIKNFRVSLFSLRHGVLQEMITPSKQINT